MKWIVAMILIGGLVIGSPVSADFYKYYDAEGNVHFTDDYNQVPPEQRDDAEQYEETGEEEPASEEAAAEDAGEESEEEVDTAEAEEFEEDDEQGSETADTEAYDLQARASEFEQRKAEIEKEYQELVEEKERLNKMAREIKTQKQLKASGYNESVQALNERMEEHDQKRQGLVSEIQQHNARLSEKKAGGEESPASEAEPD